MNYDYRDLRMNFDGFACRQSNGNTKGDCFVLDNSEITVINLGNSFVSVSLFVKKGLIVTTIQICNFKET